MSFTNYKTAKSAPFLTLRGQTKNWGSRLQSTDGFPSLLQKFIHNPDRIAAKSLLTLYSTEQQRFSSSCQHEVIQIDSKVEIDFGNAGLSGAA